MIADYGRRWVLATVVTVGVLACGPADEGGTIVTQELDCAYFTENDVLEDTGIEIDYRVPAGCVLKMNGEDTIAPGVGIEFGSDSGIAIDGNNALRAEGTADAPIVFKGATEVKGSWRGILVNSNNVNNVFEYVEISHAGGGPFNSNGDVATFILWSDSRVRIANSTLSEGLEYGVTTYPSIDLTWENNVVTTHDKEPLNITASAIDALDGASDLTGNASDKVRVFASPISENKTWNTLSVPYLMAADGNVVTVVDDAVVTVEAGTRFEFGADGGIAVQDNAGFVAQGAEDARIVFTGSTEAPGAWRGFLFESGNTQNVLDYVEIAYAGGGQFNSNGDLGAIIVWADAFLTVTNSIIRDADSECGINAPYAGEMLTNMNNTFTNISVEECQED